ncbi:MAG: glycosyltransferase [Bacilli bacterium]|nr:glycosyltransferase [Bacilli bacterium]
MHTFVVLAYKESNYLETCIKSVINQKYKSKVIIATTTDNKYIRDLAKKYKLDIKVGKHTNIGGDFDFAIKCGQTELVTIAHQDDIYNNDYSQKIVNAYNKYKKSIIIFSDYYEIRDDQFIYNNLNLIIKRILLFPLNFKILSKFVFFKRWVLRFGNAISCPAVTFVKSNIDNEVFSSKFKCDVDWFAWERLSKKSGNFIYIKDKLMGHRISQASTTTDIINQGIRTNEDYEILCKFWPKTIAKIINKLYKNSEKSNNI